MPPLRTPQPPRAQPKAPPTLPALTLTALAALENVILVAAEKNLTPTMELGWEKYQKIKALALKPSTSGEETAALKAALLQAIKLAF